MHDYDDNGKINFLSDDIQSSKNLPKMSDSTFIAPKRLCVPPQKCTGEWSIESPKQVYCMPPLQTRTEFAFNCTIFMRVGAFYCVLSGNSSAGEMGHLNQYFVCTEPFK